MERNKERKSTIDQRRASLTPATTIGGRNPTREEKQLPSRGEGAGYAPALRCVALLVCNAWMDAFVLACRQIDSSCGTKGGTLAIDEAVERRTADAPGPNRSCGTANRSCYKTRGTHAQNTQKGRIRRTSLPAWLLGAGLRGTSHLPNGRCSRASHGTPLSLSLEWLFLMVGWIGVTCQEGV